MKKLHLWQWLLLLAAAAGLLFGVVSVRQVGSHLQYIVEPAGDIAAAASDLAALAEEWASTQRAWTLGGFIQEASIKAEQSARGRVTLYGANTLDLQPLELLHGRLFTGEELSGGTPVALLDEQLALALFRDVDVSERTITLGGLTFRVIGVVRHTRQVGDYADFGAYVPLLSGLAPDALLVEADPLPGVGAGASFQTVCSLWRSGGTFIDLHKEAMSATMWLRVLGFLIGTAAALRFIRWMNSRVRRTAAWHRSALQHKYALQLLPQTTGAVLLLALGYAAAAGMAALLLDFILEPVYVFPEWAPAVLVEWEEIVAAFWRVWQPAATFRELRTPELLRLRYFKLLISGCSAVAATLLALLYTRCTSSRS